MKTILASILSVFAGASLLAQTTSALPGMDKFVKPRYRVIVDNEIIVDPDGLFQLVHQILSPSTDIKGIIGCHLKPEDPFDSSKVTAENAAKIQS
ncbi:inosine-uridine preferring nucleoside hydrolase [Chryseobacterium sp. StRB126]|uniref:hypothetical protein n=1 Tax=Chryseobacterium sp. StRB126 TaxID=878220 RepID=UPI0004E99808|nr:hypothetical protein [Chryseobacterium sp. StRB126]BAP32302.1 inosine-uridine preferring nucleoside hydrolase [Chryseobacterium sp. StRB126]